VARDRYCGSGPLPNDAPKRSTNWHVVSRERVPVPTSQEPRQGLLGRRQQIRAERRPAREEYFGVARPAGSFAVGSATQGSLVRLSSLNGSRLGHGCVGIFITMLVGIVIFFAVSMLAGAVTRRWLAVVVAGAPWPVYYAGLLLGVWGSGVSDGGAYAAARRVRRTTIIAQRGPASTTARWDGSVAGTVRPDVPLSLSDRSRSAARRAGRADAAAARRRGACIRGSHLRARAS
jgi:hypothetical protein